MPDDEEYPVKKMPSIPAISSNIDDIADDITNTIANSNVNKPRNFLKINHPFDSHHKFEIAFNPQKNEDANLRVPIEVKNGVGSLFNPYAVVCFPSVNGDYNTILDTSKNKFFPDNTKKFPSISNLVNDKELNKKTPYGYSDFLYAKYAGILPNTQLITLRRYPAPTYDNLAIPLARKDKDLSATKLPNVYPEQEYFYPIAQAVTWIGEETGNKISEILNFTVSMNWKSIQSEVETQMGNEQGSSDSPGKKLSEILAILSGDVNTAFTTQNQHYDPYSNGPYANRVYGPVNVIDKTYKRDRGLDFTQKISLNFHYSLKSIGNINPKSAMLDLLSNLLALTYNNAAFWGGAHRYFPNKPTYPFLGGREGMMAWYQGNPTGFLDSVKSAASVSKESLLSWLDAFMKDPISGLKQIAGGGLKLLMTEMGKGKAPSIVSFKSLLTGEPVGEWHLVIGNPYNPIAMIGNLILTNATFSFNDTLGTEDFPTELTMSVELEHGRPRDKGDIESMFNKGMGRIYYPYKDAEKDILNSSSATRNSENDTSYKKGHSGNGQNINEKVGLFSSTSEEFDQIITSTKSTSNEIITIQKAPFQAANLMAEQWVKNK